MSLVIRSSTIQLKTSNQLWQTHMHFECMEDSWSVGGRTKPSCQSNSRKKTQCGLARPRHCWGTREWLSNPPAGRRQSLLFGVAQACQQIFEIGRVPPRRTHNSVHNFVLEFYICQHTLLFQTSTNWQLVLVCTFCLFCWACRRLWSQLDPPTGL